MAEQKNKKRVPVQTPKMPQGGSFWVNVASSVVLLLLLVGAYGYLASSNSKAPVDIPVSTLAGDVAAGEGAGRGGRGPA